MTDSTLGANGTEPRRVQAVVALRLLEVMRDMDLPGEILEDENPTKTMPRRFGLSDVVERQIRSYRDDVRRRVRLTDHEVQGLFRLVIRRPDGEAVFERAGRLLAEQQRPSRFVRSLPKVFRFAVARVRTRRMLKRLFGRPIGGFGRQRFMIEGRALIFIESDPGGDACHLLSGFAGEILEQTVGRSARVIHTLCQGRGDDLCRWEGDLTEPRATVVAHGAGADPDRELEHRSEHELDHGPDHDATLEPNHRLEQEPIDSAMTGPDIREG